MPCTADAFCDKVDTNTYSGVNLQSPGSGQPYANMGWVGFLKLRIPSLNAANTLRVTSADINLSQEITMPDVIDGRIDRTVYQMGPKIVEGSVSLPIVADLDPDPVSGCPNLTDLQSTDTVAGSLLTNLWCWTTARGPTGRLLYNDATFEVRYANHACFKFDTCVVNTLGFNVAQSEAVNWDINVIGRGRSMMNDPTASFGGSTIAIERFLAPARVLTWNDVTINGIQGCEADDRDLFFSSQVREFNMEINNNADRYYTLIGSLFPADVNVGQREITGSITLMGLQDRLRRLAETNQDRFTEKNELRMAFYIGDDQYDVGTNTFTSRDWTDDNPKGNPLWYRRFTGVVYRIEEMSMTNDVFETVVNWLALANDQQGFEALTPGTSCSFPNWS